MKGLTGGIQMHDEVVKVGKGSTVQHGELNDRVYLMKLDEQDKGIILDTISELAYKNGYSKIFCKVPKKIAPLFFAGGYILEAYIPRFYNNNDDLFFVSKFLDSDRLLGLEKKQLTSLYQLLSDRPKKKTNLEEITSGYTVRLLDKADAEEITGIYRDVFESYPFPIHSREYIIETMDRNVKYFGAEKKGKLVALASSEIDSAGKNAEMTDFATKNSHSGKNLSSVLLKAMEKVMGNQGITTLYTIARLNSIPMNKTFLRLDYKYSGTLIKNTNIAGKIESMNIYYKHI